MISRVRRVFEIELAVRTVFEEPTIAELAERIEAANLAKVNAPGWLLDHEVTLAHLPKAYWQKKWNGPPRRRCA